MKKIISLFSVFHLYLRVFPGIVGDRSGQFPAVGGSNQQAYKALEKVLETLSIIPAGQGRSFRILKKSNVALPLLLRKR
jgi:hypothetical protein